VPLFVTFEGPDGSGKSTQARLLAAAFRRQGLNVVETREPGGTPLGERIRELLLDPESPRPIPLAMALLLSASRAQLLSDVILPALGRGAIVICDRYADSTMAYQSYGLGLDAEVVRDMTAIATNGVQPDVGIYVDVPIEVGLSRAVARGALNRLDAETIHFHRNVRSGYLRIVAEEPDRWFVVDGTQSVETVHRQIMTAISPLLAGMSTA
jgi:dTMP kinase